MEKRRRAKELEERRRSELFGNSESNANGGQTAIDLGEYGSSEVQKLHGFHQNIDDLLASGGNILNSLKHQRTVLDGVHKRVVDIGNTLGLSNTVMRLIEKRAYFDKFILFGGMAVFLMLILLCWIYVL